MPHPREVSLDICAYAACRFPQLEISITGVPASSDGMLLDSSSLCNTDHCIDRWSFPEIKT